ncbi:MAG TPA: CBS domain-containing protein, partial [Acidimicrobiales bacterium]
VTHDIDEAIKLADRIAILNVGGVLEQYGTPEELLRAPANEFVERFLGRERGLKRMALLKVSDVELDTGPVVAAGAEPGQARAVMRDHRVDWVGVSDGGRLLGWVAEADLDGQGRVGDAPRQRFAASVRPDTALRQALDQIVQSRTRVAVVLGDDDRYLGMLDIARISDRMAT